MRRTQHTKTCLETSLDGVAEMAHATETQARGLDPDLSQNGYGAATVPQSSRSMELRLTRSAHEARERTSYPRPSEFSQLR